ncbi:MAG: SpoIIE family protein phosphatase [Candidatus Promineifilaceae bacterium]|nr:SpoIIE family protein phosphatase [Candidatus Promineifilaceae bacterium]
MFQSLNAQAPMMGTPWQSISLIILVGAILVTTMLLWRRFFSRRMLIRRIAELETLSVAGRAIVASEFDVMALSRLIAEEANKIIEAPTFQVGLFEDHRYRLLYWMIDGLEQNTPQSYDVGETDGLINWVRNSQSPLLVYDFAREMNKLPAQPTYVSQSPPRSALFIPLVSGEETVGIIAAQSNQPQSFGEQDKRRLMILANQSAAAFANARLFEQAQMRAAHLELVSQIARQVNAVQDLDEIFDQVVALTQETFDFDPVNIFSLDPLSGDALLQASSDQAINIHGARLLAGQGIVGAAATERETIVSNNTEQDQRFVSQLQLHQEVAPPDTKAEIAIPLIVNDEILGVLDVQSPVPGVFTETEKTVLEALAAEVASAIHKARQLAWQQEQAWITTAQLQVAEAISRSSNLDELISAITRLTPMLTGVSLCSILLWDDELEQYEVTGYSDSDSESLDAVMVRIGDWHALDAVHVGRQSLSTRHIPDWLTAALPKTHRQHPEILLLPLIVSEHAQSQGVMVVDQLPVTLSHSEHNEPDPARIDLLQNIAQQTAQAVESARLRVAQEEEAWVNTALLQVAEAVNSLIDLNEILDTIVRLVPMLVGVQSIVILIRDRDQKLFVPGPSFGVGSMGRGLLATLEIDDQEFQSMTSPTVHARLPSDFVYNVRLPAWLETVLEAQAAYAFPLNAQGRLVGAMMVGMPTDNNQPLSARRLNILNGIAQQAATAVVNNQLYRESAERLRMQQELDVARDIQASFLPDGSPDIPGSDVASLWLAARQVSGDFYDFLPRADGTWGIVIADVADKGVPAALFMALSRTILRTVGFNRKDPADVLMRVNEIISIDAQSDLFVTIFYAVWNPKTKEILYANGGHNPPLLLDRKGDLRLLKAPGIALGVLPTIELKSHSAHLRSGDMLILYTDGVTEAVNEDFDEFGMERLYLAARAARSQSAHSIVETISENIYDHAGGTPQFDDVTLVVMKLK